MAVGRASRTVRGAGRVVIGPTDLSTTYPYGGTEVGLSMGCALLPLGRPYRVESEGLGEATDILEADNQYVFSCILRGWDDDAVEKLLSGGFIAGGTTRHATWEEPGTKTPGASSIPRAVILLYVPDDLIRNPALLAYRAIPDWTDGAELAFQRTTELGLPLAFDLLRGATPAKLFTVGRFPDLSLT